MIPAGPLVSIAFAAFARREDKPRVEATTAQRIRSILMLLVGLPSVGSNLTTRRAMAVSVVALVAGAVMATAGYTIADWNQALVPPVILTGGAVITIAFVIAGRGFPAQHSDDIARRTPLANKHSPCQIDGSFGTD